MRGGGHPYAGVGARYCGSGGKLLRGWGHITAGVRASLREKP